MDAETESLTKNLEQGLEELESMKKLSFEQETLVKSGNKQLNTAITALNQKLVEDNTNFVSEYKEQVEEESVTKQKMRNNLQECQQVITKMTGETQEEAKKTHSEMEAICRKRSDEAPEQVTQMRELTRVSITFNIYYNICIKLHICTFFNNVCHFVRNGQL